MLADEVSTPQGHRSSSGSSPWPSILLRHGSSNTGYAASDAASQRTSTTPCSATGGKLKGGGASHNHNTPSVTLDEIRDKILEMAMDRSGSRVLQKLISDTSASAADGGSHEELEKLIDAIIHEIQPVLSRIMCDTYANYMCQQLFQVSSAEQRIALLRNVLENIVYISQDRRGTHSLQALIACMQTPQEHALLAETLHDNVNKMALDVHATHVLQQTITKCTPDGPGKEYSHLPMADFGFIFDDIYRNLEALAGDPNGLGVVKKCISHAPWYGDGSYVEKYKSKMLNKLQYFVENPYANYAVQHALEIWGPEVCSDIITKISESIISMAIHKFASNVVETALKVSPDDMRVMLIHRLIDYGNTSCQNAAMITLMNSAYGVFVMSTALRLAPTTELCEQIYGALVRNYQRLPDSRNKQKWDKVLVMAEKRCKKDHPSSPSDETQTVTADLKYSPHDLSPNEERRVVSSQPPKNRGRSGSREAPTAPEPEEAGWFSRGQLHSAIGVNGPAYETWSAFIGMLGITDALPVGME
ncbi:pumilio domain member 4 [Perkinsus olseni]|uniref:Pumilio domain member 4 n=1 Tax=Perkinsus olseni TaxID=32597 RepID=A0A7J6MRM9_PEROL|nr:pumilio domain member 4 [Perkinsus olseni]